MAKNYIIVGSGFRGFCDALELSKNPKNNVHIIESSKYFGGITNSIFTKGFFVDKGVHHFDSIPQRVETFDFDLHHLKSDGFFWLFRWVGTSLIFSVCYTSF